MDKDTKQITYSSTAIGELPVADGLSSEATTSGKTKYDGKSVLNWYTRSSGIGAGKNAVDSVSDTTATYGDVTEYVANTKIAKLDAPASDASYGIPTQFVVRVWLEGEDPDCWNETAGQDWSINLCFNNETTNVSKGGTEQDAAGNGRSGGTTGGGDSNQTGGGNSNQTPNTPDGGGE